MADAVFLALCVKKYIIRVISYINVGACTRLGCGCFIFPETPHPTPHTPFLVIFEEGQPGDYMYGILEGEVDLSVHNKIIETIKAGDVFGAGALVGIKNRTYTAIAKTDCKLAFLDERRFLFAVQETPMFALLVMRSYSQRLSRLEHQV